jgi:hypothetical protein
MKFRAADAVVRAACHHTKLSHMLLNFIFDRTPRDLINSPFLGVFYRYSNLKNRGEVSLARKMEAAKFFETSLSYYITTRCHNLYDHLCRGRKYRIMFALDEILLR